MRYAALVLGLCLISSACDGGTEIVGPLTGSVEITTTTTGTTDAAGYTVSINGEAPEAIGLNASLTRADLAPGAYSVQLGSVPDGCTVAGDNPRGVTIRPGETAPVTFAVTCVP
jgi:hypothetical protein